MSRVKKIAENWDLQENVDPNEDKDLIPLLNRALGMEYGAVIQYYHHKAVFSGLHQSSYQDIIKHNIEEEIKHIELLSNKIVALGGTPSTEAIGVNPGKTAKEIIQNDIDSESAALTVYYDIHKKVKDLSLKLMIETIITDETEHYDNLKRVVGTFDE